MAAVSSSLAHQVRAVTPAHSLGSSRSSLVATPATISVAHSTPPSVRARGHAAVSIRAEDYPAVEERTQVDTLPTGEWEKTFSRLNVSDLSNHFKARRLAPPPPPQPEVFPLEADESHGVVSAEWSMNLSILTYQDLHEYFQEQLFKAGARPQSMVATVMTRDVRTASPDDRLADILHHFEHVSGLPVVDAERRCVGIIVRGDVEGATSADVRVRDLMTSPAPVVMRPNKSVLFAATLMLKNMVRRIPIVNRNDHLVGIVTRSDIFRVLEAAD